MAILLSVIILEPLPSLDARSRKGDKFFAEGKVHEAKKEWDAALASYQKALAEDPAEMVYEMSVDRARFQAAQVHVDAGIKIRAQGRLGEALLEFQEAHSINPGSIIAGEQLNASMEMIARERKRVEATGKESPPDIRALTPYEEARRKESERISRILSIPELKSLGPHSGRLAPEWAESQKTVRSHRQNRGNQRPLRSGVYRARQRHHHRPAKSHSRRGPRLRQRHH